MLTLHVRCFNGKKVEIAAERGNRTTVTELQAAVESKAGIPPANQLIMYKGKVLDDVSGSLAQYGIGDDVSEATMSVVRNVGNGAATGGAVSAASATGAATRARSGSGGKVGGGARAAAAGARGRSTAGGGGGGGGAPDVDALMRQLQNMSAASAGSRSGNRGAGGSAAAEPTRLLEAMMGGGGAGGGGGGGASSADTMQMMSQMAQMMSGLWDSPALQEYFNSPEKQEESRQALLNNPFLRQWMDADPHFREVVDDPDKWAESMQAARELFAQQGRTGAEGGGGDAMAAAAAAATAGRRSPMTGGAADADDEPDTTEDAVQAARESARLRDERTRQLAREKGLDTNKLSEGYGFALGQALLNSAFGLDHDLVIRGLRDALAGKDFPMSVSEYERQMGQLQSLANDVLGEANLEEARAFFETAKSMPDMFKPLEEGRILWEEMQVEEEEDDDDDDDDDEGEGGQGERGEAAARRRGAQRGGTGKKCGGDASYVTLILQGRLLDGRFFFTCPAEDDGEMVTPLTLKVGDAPSALRRAILDMSEGETRTVYVHPDACDGMSDMFGQMLPKNALLIFDIEMVQTDVPPEPSNA